MVSATPVETPFLYHGMYGVMTDGSGLYYMRARYYNPEIRRFLNQDVLLGTVVNGQSLNQFAFVNGNPVSFVDPEGKLGILAGIAIGLGVWAIAEIVIPTLFPPDIEAGSGEVIPSALPDIVSGLFNATNAATKTTTSCLKRGFGKEGLSLNPIEWYRTRQIAKRANDKGFTVVRHNEESYVDVHSGKPVIFFNYRASGTAAIEEYMHARISQRALDKGTNVHVLVDTYNIYIEEGRLKTRLIKSGYLNTFGSRPLKVDVPSLQRSLENYIIEFETMKALDPKNLY